MRTGATLYTTSTMTTKETFSPAATVQRSPWHSPLPYLFGGLASMLCLIALALLILACSYRKLSRRLDNGEGGSNRDVEAGDEKEKPSDTGKSLPVFEEKIVVIMAGDEKPRFLATPMSSTSRASSFGDNNGKSEKAEIAEKPKQEIGDHGQAAAAALATTTTAATTMENRETQ